MVSKFGIYISCTIVSHRETESTPVSAKKCLQLIRRWTLSKCERTANSHYQFSLSGSDAEDVRAMLTVPELHHHVITSHLDIWRALFLAGMTVEVLCEAYKRSRIA